MEPTERFSSRVADYVKYRPSYPREIITHLTKTGTLTPGSVVADVGSGTGLLTQLFLENQNIVFGVEPNANMRAAGEAFLAGYPRFNSIAATAEATTLADHSVDLIVAGQAFHWFDQKKTRAEFQRILKPGGHVALIWNDRLVNTPFLVAYEELLKKFSTDYARVDHRLINLEVIKAFFAPNPVSPATFSNEQVFDFAALRGRLLSSSYAPAAGQATHEPMLALLRDIYDHHAQEERVVFAYETKVYVAQLLS